MESKEFVSHRKRLKKTQAQMAQLLGVSVKAVHSYEQGWRAIPPHIERQLLFLLSRSCQEPDRLENCWEIMACPDEKKEVCPAWEFKAGKLCWFVTGTVCSGTGREAWKEKIKTCRKCRGMAHIFKGHTND